MHVGLKSTFLNISQLHHSTCWTLVIAFALTFCLHGSSPSFSTSHFHNPDEISSVQPTHHIQDADFQPSSLSGYSHCFLAEAFVVSSECKKSQLSAKASLANKKRIVPYKHGIPIIFSHSSYS
jgi:hypothetical protein